MVSQPGMTFALLTSRDTLDSQSPDSQEETVPEPSRATLAGEFPDPEDNNNKEAPKKKDPKDHWHQ